MVKITYIFFSSIWFKALRLPFLWAFEPPCFLPCCSTSTGCPASTSPWQWTLLGLCSAARSWVLLRGCSPLLLAGWMLSGQGCRWSIKQSCQVGVLLSLAPFPPSFPSLSVSLLCLIFLGGGVTLSWYVSCFIPVHKKAHFWHSWVHWALKDTMLLPCQVLLECSHLNALSCAWYSAAGVSQQRIPMLFTWPCVFRSHEWFSSPLQPVTNSPSIFFHLVWLCSKYGVLYPSCDMEQLLCCMSCWPSPWSVWSDLGRHWRPQNKIFS